MKKKILIAPLNWGLGHATRCIPIIKALEENGFEPIIASDGVALALLKKRVSETFKCRITRLQHSILRKRQKLQMEISTSNAKNDVGHQKREIKNQ